MDSTRILSLNLKLCSIPVDEIISPALSLRHSTLPKLSKQDLASEETLCAENDLLQSLDNDAISLEPDHSDVSSDEDIVKELSDDNNFQDICSHGDAISLTFSFRSSSHNLNDVAKAPRRCHFSESIEQIDQVKSSPPSAPLRNQEPQELKRRKSRFGIGWGVKAFTQSTSKWLDRRGF
jgi:hypothetical protein